MKKYIKPSLTINELGVENHLLDLSKTEKYAKKDGTVLSRDEEMFWDEEQGW